MRPFLLLFCSHGELKRTRLNWFVWSSVNSIIHASPDRKCIETCCLFLLLEQCLYCYDLHASVHSLLGAVCKITRCTCILHIVAFCFHSRNSSLSHLCVLFGFFSPKRFWKIPEEELRFVRRVLGRADPQQVLQNDWSQWQPHSACGERHFQR